MSYISYCNHGGQIKPVMYMQHRRVFNLAFYISNALKFIRLFEE